MDSKYDYRSDRREKVLNDKFCWFNRFELFAEDGEPIQTTLNRLKEFFPLEIVPTEHWFIGLFKEILTDEYRFSKEMESDTCEYCEYWEDDEPEIEKIKAYRAQRPKQKRNYLFTDSFFDWLYDLVKNNDVHCGFQTIAEFRQTHERNHEQWEQGRMKERQSKLVKRIKLIDVGTDKLSISDKILWFERLYDLSGNDNLITVVKRLHERFPQTEVPSEDWFRVVLKEYLSDAPEINDQVVNNHNFGKIDDEEQKGLSVVGSFLTSNFKNFGKIIPIYSDAFNVWACEVAKDTSNEDFSRWMIDFRESVGKTQKEIDEEQNRALEILKKQTRVKAEIKHSNNSEAINGLPF